MLIKCKNGERNVDIPSQNEVISENDLSQLARDEAQMVKRQIGENPDSSIEDDDDDDDDADEGNEGSDDEDDEGRVRQVNQKC